MNLVVREFSSRRDKDVDVVERGSCLTAETQIPHRGHADDGDDGEVTVQLKSTPGNTSLEEASLEDPSPLPVGGERRQHRHLQQSLETCERMTPSLWMSNFLFLVGSSLYVWLAVWDMRRESSYTDDAAGAVDDDAQSSQDGTTAVVGFWSRYMALSAAAASCYVIVAILQIFPCIVLSRRGSGNGDPGSVSNTVSWSLGLSFGCGAILDLLSAVSGTMRDQRITNITAWGAAHSYLANAVILLLGTSQPKADSNPATTPTSAPFEEAAVTRTLSEQAEFLGDYLFLVGSLVDVSLSYFYFSGNSLAMWKNIYVGNLVTAVLWLVDSILYIAADMLAIRQLTTATTQSTVAGTIATTTFSEQNAITVPLLEPTNST
jgi:hypothetical protein